MLLAAHSLVYSDDAPATRVFFRDVLQLPYVAEDETVEEPWLIFKTGPSEFGVHPTRNEEGAEGQEWARAGTHQLCFVVDDIAATRAELESRGAQFTGDTEDAGFGLVAMLQVPGAAELMLYEAKHPTAYDR